MITKSITYTNYNGEEVKEDFRFNISKAELAELELKTVGGLERYIRTIMDAKDQVKIAEFFKKIICLAYGEKSDDGKYFQKSPEKLNAFLSTEAYSELFMELITNEEKAAEFVNGIIPKIN